MPEDYHKNIHTGIYKTKSLSLSYSSIDTVSAQRTMTEFGNYTGLLVTNRQPIILFKNNSPEKQSDVLGVLYENSIITVDEINYRGIYKDPNVEWGVSFDVWYKIRINDLVYYTDYKIHDFIAFKKPLEKLNQTFILFAQSTGYDYSYDSGYPEHFFVLVLNDKDEIIYASEELDFESGEEFWEPDLGSVEWEILESGNFQFTLSGMSPKDYNKRIEFTKIWNGHSLID